MLNHSRPLCESWATFAVTYSFWHHHIPKQCWGKQTKLYLFNKWWLSFSILHNNASTINTSFDTKKILQWQAFIFLRTNLKDEQYFYLIIVKNIHSKRFWVIQHHYLILWYKKIFGKSLYYTLFWLNLIFLWESIPLN